MFFMAQDFMPPDWELISGSKFDLYTVHRLQVPNGWIYWNRSWSLSPSIGEDEGSYNLEGADTVFVPASHHLSIARGHITESPLGTDIVLAMGISDSMIPQYIKNEFYKMRDMDPDATGNLWVSQELQDHAPAYLPKDHPAIDIISERMNGIVIRVSDLWSIITWPGFLTDFSLNPIHVDIKDKV
jgi:hypothetical protein